MSEQLPPKRIWRGFGTILATLFITYALWIGAMAWTGEWYESAWKYPAKVGSHGCLILMCWAFVLATRFRPVEWLFGGLDKVYKAHRVVGETAFFLIFLHPIFLAIAFAEDAGGFFRYLWFSDDWVRNTGLIGLAVFVLLVVLSIYVKIAYHKWKRTHDFFGLLLVLIVIHAVISGGEIMQYPILTIWHGFWVSVGLLSYTYIRLFYRFVGPQFDYVTTGVKNLADEITEVYLEPVGRPMHPRPGQFVYISLDADAVSEEPHPFSISSAPHESALRLSIKRLGDWTSDIHRVEEGEPARVWGPYGHFSDLLLSKPKLPAVLIGGGIGVTPFLSIVGSRAIRTRKSPLTMIYSTPRPEASVYADELRRALDEIPAGDLVEHHSDTMGFIDRAYLESVLDRPLKDHLFLVCGPGPMMQAINSLLLDADVQPKQIVMEAFDIR